MLTQFISLPHNTAIKM